MELHAKIALSLPNKFYKITLKYDTYQKATYDSYLVASIIANQKNKTDAMKYIDEITGKGSLNAHFKKLYDEISEFSDEQIKGILKDSLFPITIIDKKHHFKFYEMFNASRMDDKVYLGNLENDGSLKDMLMPKDNQSKFLSLDFDVKDGTIKTDNYNAIFSDEGIKIDLDGGTYLPISKSDFELVYKNDLDGIEDYQGKIGSEITSGNWSVLNNTVLSSLGKSKLSFIDDDGNVCTITNDYLKKTEVIKVFSLYFFKETAYYYTIKNAEICESIVAFLMKTKAINEFKTKSLICLLASVSDKTAQKVINYFLSRKDSKEISEMGLKLIKDGLEKGWEEEVLKSIKKSVPSSEFKYLYRISPNLGFEVTDLLDIDNADLTELDAMRKKQYLADRKNMLDSISLWIGEITTSAVREKMKKLPTKDSVYKAFNSFINQDMAHLREDLSEMSDRELKAQYEKVKSMYSSPYQKILERIKKMEDE